MKKKNVFLCALLCLTFLMAALSLYLNSDRSGWAEEKGQTVYLDPRGKPASGWQTVEGKLCFFDKGGIPAQGWREIQGKYHYFREGGRPWVGWFSEGDYQYFLGLDGSPVTEPTQIDGRTYYFSPQGIHIWLVNHRNPLLSDYETELVTRTDGYVVSAACYQALEDMLAACTDAGHSPAVISAYRDYAYQAGLFEEKVRQVGKEAACQVVAQPGTSEHQLGLAVDLVDNSYPILDEAQAETKTQKWLMEHCWEYGFILRYPPDTTEITGIIYEPWHYRYVGITAALEIRDLGITLEEYLKADTVPIPFQQ